MENFLCGVMTLFKKGQVFAEENVNMAVDGVFLVVVLTLIVLIFMTAIDRDIDTLEIEQHTSVYRLFSSPNCFGYSDGDVFVPGVIDLTRFNEVTLNGCFSLPDGKRTGIELKLSYLDGTEIGFYEINKEVVSQKIRCGLENAEHDCLSTRKYVLVSDGGKLKKAILDIMVVNDIE
jgi:hypothetical protein